MPLLLGALLALSDSTMSRPQRIRLGFDGLVVAGGGFMAIWYAYINPALSLGRTALPLRLSMITYPPLDLVLILGVCVILVQGVRSTPRRVLTLLLAGTLAYLANDLYVSYQTVHVPGWQQGNLFYTTSVLPLMMIAAAAVEQSRPADPHTSVTVPELSRHMVLLPSIALVTGFGMMLFAAVSSGSTTLTGLVFGALAMVSGVLARQLYALRENQLLLSTDGLTGLPNRIELSRVLRRVLDRNRREAGTSAMLVIDLNGFKQVNDTYGHDAGDQLLTVFGRVLREQIRPGDTPARLGGDEFAVVLNTLRSPDDAIVVAQRIVRGADQETPLPGRQVNLRASIGIALVDPAIADAEEAAQDVLRRADSAMYIAKRAGGNGWHLDGTPAPVRPEHLRGPAAPGRSAPAPAAVARSSRRR